MSPRALQGDALDVRALNIGVDGNNISETEQLQNHTLCANAATAIGCGVRDLAAQRLAQAPKYKQLTLSLVWNLTKTGLLAPLSGTRRAELSHLMATDDDATSFAKMASEEVRPAVCASSCLAPADGAPPTHTSGDSASPLVEGATALGQPPHCWIRRSKSNTEARRALVLRRRP